ncbi:MAG: PadR family transcriptional regulator [Hadesarchaea archaeon DG-33-1]|nr:MAG: PadR family transcriptional regulator [Hadesarchaea archaeon DG-33-1]
MLWPYILRLLQERPMYAYELRQEINKNFGWKPPMVTSYTVLYRLQRKGYLTTEWQEQRGKPARKYYKITDKGRGLLKEADEYFTDLYKKLFKKRTSP